jgi:mono/diheme cytochrome c family protein
LDFIFEVNRAASSWRAVDFGDKQMERSGRYDRSCTGKLGDRAARATENFWITGEDGVALMTVRTATVLFALSVTALPGQAADLANGKRLSERWCASCHVVSPEQRGTASDAPPFSTVARQPGVDAGRLALFLLEPHPKMPSMSLTRAEAADIAGYITSLTSR